MNYVVIASDYDDSGLLGIYDTIDKAKEAIQEIADKKGLCIIQDGLNECGFILTSKEYGFYRYFAVYKAELNITYDI